MEPLLSDGDRVELCQSEECRPTHGDLIIFKSPTAKQRLVVKKLLGVPGDKLGKTENNQVTINGVPIRGLDDQPLTVPTSRHAFFNLYQGTLKGYWVVGRRGSADSFRIGALPSENVVGVATKH